MRPSFEVRSRPTVISSKPTSNIVDGIDRDAKHKTKLIEPNMTRTDRSPAFAFPKNIIEWLPQHFMVPISNQKVENWDPTLTYPNNDLKGEST